MLRKSDWFALTVIACLLVAGGLWWSDLEKRALDAEKPAQVQPRQGPEKPKVLKKPAKGFGKVRLPAAHWCKARRHEKGKRMPVLPGGFVRCRQSESLTLSGSGTLKLWMVGNVGDDANTEWYWNGLITLSQYVSGYYGPMNSAYIATHSIFTLQGIMPGDDPEHDFYYVCFVIASDGAGNYTELERRREYDPWTGYSSEYGVSWSHGPLVLGAKYECPAPDEGGPAFSAKHGALSHRWFATAATALTITGPGGAVTTYPYTEDTDLGPWASGFSWGGTIYSTGVDAAIITGLTISGWEMDTTGLDSALNNPALYGCMKGFGGGECRLNSNYSPTGQMSGSAYASPPVSISYDLQITKFGKEAWAGATLTDNVLTVPLYDTSGNLLQPYLPDGITMPYQATHVFPLVPWVDEMGRKNGYVGSGASFNLQAAWRAAQDPPLPANDTYVPVRGPTPNGGATYTPVSLTLAQSIACHRPDGNNLSSYVTSDAAKLTVAEGAAETVFNTTTAGASATRTLATDWAKYVTKTNPAWDYFTHRITKHAAGTEDVWWWGSYAYLDLVFRCATACSLTLTVNWTKPEITDIYLSDSTRYDEWVCDLHAGASTYTVALVAQPGSDQTVQVRLLFPNEGGPAYLGRVTSIKIEGLPVGTVTLKGVNLVSGLEDDGSSPSPYYVKIAPGPPVQRGKYSYVGIAHDGATATMLIPDTAYKPNEMVEYGGNMRYVEPMTGAQSGIITDSQLVIGTVASWLNYLEGVTCTYSLGASDAALSDSDGAKLAPENADWLLPVYPNAANATPGIAKSLQAAVMCRSIFVTNGISWTVTVNHALMAGIEALTHEGNAPGEAGIEMQAYWMDGATKMVDPVAAGTTDRHGFAVVAPIPADGSRAYSVEQVPA